MTLMMVVVMVVVVPPVPRRLMTALTMLVIGTQTVVKLWAGWEDGCFGFGLPFLHTCILMHTAQC